MCTVTYHPYKNHYILTSNRDEHYLRKIAASPKKYVLRNEEILFPKDLEAGGTWIAASEKGRVLTILNGAFEKHEHTPPYRKSRGLVILDAFKYESLSEFINNYDLTNIEPFTLVSVSESDALSIHELRWDGEDVYLKELDASQPHIWRSSTLYSVNDRTNKTQKYVDFCRSNNINSLLLLEFNKLSGDSAKNNDIILKRNSFGVETVAITQIIAEAKSITMKFNNLLTNEIITTSIQRKELSKL